MTQEPEQQGERQYADHLLQGAKMGEQSDYFDKI